MKRLIVAAIAALCIAAPAAGQSRTLGNLKAPIARASGQVPARSVKDLWAQINGLPAFKPTLGDVEEPELGVDFSKVPSDIPTLVDVAAKLLQPWPVPADNGPDPIGAFRFICQAGQVSYDDPLAFPKQPGKSHLHQWFGNTAANASSTYESLRTKGESTCGNILNRSAYWMPAMLDGKGHVVRPDFVSIYYKRLPASDPRCGTGAQAMGKQCVDLPRGLRFIFGDDAMTGKPATDAAFFDCNGVGATSGHFETITEAAKGCTAGSRLGAVISAPPCWDGKRLDGPNHRDHLADTSYGSWGYSKCPATHPYVLQAFLMGSWYGVDEAGDVTWYLSSDDMPGMARMPAGSTFHADWFGAWDELIKTMWMDNCINRHLNCDKGNLANGKALLQAGEFSWTANPRLVTVPPRR